MQKRILTIRVKTRDSWVRIDNVTVNYWVTYEQQNLTWYKDIARYVEIKQLDIPSWASYYKKTIQAYLENNPQELNETKNGSVLNVQ